MVVVPCAFMYAMTAVRHRAFSTISPAALMRGPTIVPAVMLSRHRSTTGSPPMSRTLQA
jgi:hypothetical protein